MLAKYQLCKQALSDVTHAYYFNIQIQKEIKAIKRTIQVLLRELLDLYCHGDDDDIHLLRDIIDDRNNNINDLLSLQLQAQTTLSGKIHLLSIAG